MATNAKVLMAAMAAAALLVVLVGGCREDDESTDGRGGAGGGEPDPDVVAVLQSLPVFPKAEASSLADGKYTYVRGSSETGRDIRTGFAVSPDTTPEEITSFFARELPARGWKEEGPPRTEVGEKNGSVSRAMMYTFLKDGFKLGILIQMNPPKDATPPPGGVTGVQLILVPQDTPLFGTPAGTPVESTPPPTAPQKTPDYTEPPLPSYVPTPVTPTP